MKILLDLFPILPIYPLSRMIKRLQLGSQGFSYVIMKARFVVSFQHILDPGFGTDSASVFLLTL